MQETLEKRVWSLDQEDPLEEGMVTQSIILAWRIPGQRLLGYRMGSQRVQHDWSDLARTDSMHCAVNLINGEILVKENHIVSDFIGLTVYWGIRIIKQLRGKKKQLQYGVSRAVSRKWRMLPKPSQGESHFSASTEAPVCSLGSRTSALGQTPKERVTNGPSSFSPRTVAFSMGAGILCSWYPNWGLSTQLLPRAVGTEWCDAVGHESIFMTCGPVLSWIRRTLGAAWVLATVAVGTTSATWGFSGDPLGERRNETGFFKTVWMTHTTVMWLAKTLRV